MVLYKQNWGSLSAVHKYKGKHWFRVDSPDDLKPYWQDSPDVISGKLSEYQDYLERLYQSEPKRRRRLEIINDILK